MSCKKTNISIPLKLFYEYIVYRIYIYIYMTILCLSLLINTFSKYLLSTYYTLDSILGTINTTVRKQ